MKRPGDMTIPVHPAGERRGRATTLGRFVDYGDRTVLASRGGDTWSADYVRMMQPFGNRESGVEAMPRAWKFGANNVVEIEGDVVIIDFIDGDPRLPLVRGTLRAAKPADFFHARHDVAGANTNAVLVRVVALDDSGTKQGEVRVRVCDDDTGSLVVEGTKRIELFVGADLDGTTGLTLTVADGKVTVSKGGGVEPALLGETFLQDLSGALQDIITGLAGVPYVATLVGLFKAKVDAALYLSATVEVQ